MFKKKMRKKCNHHFNVSHVRYIYSKLIDHKKWLGNEWRIVRNDFYTVSSICQKCEGETRDNMFIRRGDEEAVTIEINGWKPDQRKISRTVVYR